MEDELQLLLFQKPGKESEVVVQNLYVNHRTSEAVPRVVSLIKNVSAILVILIPWWLSSTASKAADKEETKYTCEEELITAWK